MKALMMTLLTGALFSMALHAGPQGSDAVIEKMIAAYGGEKNIAQLNNYEQVWHIETKTSDTNGTDRRSVHLPLLLRTALEYPDKSEIRTLIKDYGTKQFGQKKIEAKGPMLDAMKLQLMRLYHPLLLKEKRRDITLSETPRHFVLALKADSITAEYFVSKTNYLVDKVAGHLTMGSREMTFLTRYEDYAPLNGVMLARKEIKYAGSVNTAVMRLQQMTFTAPPKKHP